MSVRIKWHPQKFNAELDVDLDSRLKKGAIELSFFVKSLFGSNGYPGIKTGNLKNSIAAEKIGKLNWGVGSDVSYAKDLEYGTGNMSALPFLRPSINLFKGRIASFFRR